MCKFLGKMEVLLNVRSTYLNFQGRAVQTAKSLDEGLRAVVKISHETIFDSNDNHLVHLSGKLKTNLVSILFLTYLLTLCV